ncbi:hypothetical protein AM493_16875 [Flavobacterium akiainvivens]|uniref:Uncharacterized protein n=1 Tax=Flavobacterium akiainvivens TaxID=1202724 RepID=A0A0N0RQZ6_9FLAO|nr:hypothetical protein [Flavobacterium akiainvivens]KOS07530.1 hypothetical protein AM493_16875 [Flavobacterium akiainvivens]SFQ64097.1 hypothetical protein SAMN05444144_111102 [Flavobacterium akiainvivens]
MKSSKVLKQLWLACFSATALTATWFLAPYFKVENILALQFSCTPGDLCFMINGQETALRHNLLLDFGFIVCYTLLFYYSIQLMGHLLKLSKLHYTWLCLLPGLLDVAENIITLNIIDSNNCTAIFTPFFYIVRIKWLTVLPFGLLALMMGVYLLLEYLDEQSCRREKQK